MDDKTLLWHLYEDNRAHARFHETQRLNGSALIGGGAAVIIAAIADDGYYARSEWPLAAVLILIGIFGFFFCMKSSQLMQLHLNRCTRFLHLLDDMDSTFDVTAIKSECDLKTAGEFPFAHKLKLRAFWQAMHGMVALAGVAMLGCIYLG